MLLKAAVEEGGGESIEPFCLSEPGDPVHSEVETDATLLNFAEYDLSEPFFHACLLIFRQNSDVVVFGVDCERVQSSQVFGIGMDVGIEKNRGKFMAFGFQIIVRYDQARRAACMKKDSHEKGCLLSSVMV